MSLAHVPAVYADGRRQSSDEIERMARRCRAETLDVVGERHPLLVTALPTSEGIALFAAPPSLPWPIVLFGPKTEDWAAPRQISSFPTSLSCRTARSAGRGARPPWRSLPHGRR
jgi:hypothetical protein